MRQHYNKIAILFVIVMSFTIFYFIQNIPTSNHERNALKTADSFSFHLKKVTTNLEVIPNKPEVGNVLVTEQSKTKL